MKDNNKLIQKINQLKLAEQQLYGFHCAKSGDSLLSLIQAMGLTQKEFKKIQDQNMLNFLSETDLEEIKKYFKLQNIKCTCESEKFGLDCICSHTKKYPGITNFCCEFCGIYSAGKPRCNKCEIEKEN